MTFRHGNVSFTVIQKKKGTSKIWFVRSSVFLGTLKRRKPGEQKKPFKPIEMKAKDIVKYAGEHIADIVISQLHTVGVCEGSNGRNPTNQEMRAKLAAARSRSFSQGSRATIGARTAV